jgi:hypothetical protein
MQTNAKERKIHKKRKKERKIWFVGAAQYKFRSDARFLT